MAKFFVLILLAVFSLPVFSAPYYNSSEAGCDGSDSNVLMCDDFEDGVWYHNDADHVQAVDDAWYGTIYCCQPGDPTPAPNYPEPADAIICGAGVTPFGNCAGNGGYHEGGWGNANMAIHGFKTPSCGTNGSEKCGVSTVYVRWYAKWLSGYAFSGEKHMNPTDMWGDIAFVNVQLECGQGHRLAPGASASVALQVLHGTSMCQYPNISAIEIEPGNWYFFELRITVSSGTSGILQLWINNCGPDGTTCGASPVLRTERTGLNLPGNVNGSLVSAVWLENWANNNDGDGSLGTGPYWDQLKVSTVGPIGFADSGEEELPSTVQNFRLLGWLIALGLLGILGGLYGKAIPGLARRAHRRIWSKDRLAATGRSAEPGAVGDSQAPGRLAG